MKLDTSNAFCVSRMQPPAELPATSLMLSLGGSLVDFQAEPLFESIGSGNALGADLDKRWYVLTPPIALDEPNVWDLCHSLMQGSFGIADIAPEFAEPDIQQRWTLGQPVNLGLSAARTCEAQNGHNPNHPAEHDPLWFQDVDHSRFEGTTIARAKGVRVVHLDTGYDPSHHALPRHLNRTLQRNFVDDDRPNDALDDTPGPLTTSVTDRNAGDFGWSGDNGGRPIGSAPDDPKEPRNGVVEKKLFFEITL